MRRAARPPAAPTDPRPGVIVAGRVTAVRDESCRDVVDGRGRVWSLRGPVDEPVSVGDTVRWRVRHLESDDGCGPGTPAWVVSTRTDAR